ncbi:MAG: iron-sulfur cluster repair di-iron protein [Cytophagales bacterium]|jgi:regulator of cell morphogenesis and NO signaling|nr:iron-sulfur cluster repair di-iron protein [Cytophagales bacterium]
METLENTIASVTVGEIVADNHLAANVFEKYGIDFCCGGKRTLFDACARKSVSVDKVVADLVSVLSQRQPMPSQSYNHWPLDFLADYIVQTHHAYLRRELPTLEGYVRKLASVHADRHPELVRIAQLFLTLHDELTAHLGKEEQILFPYVKRLVALQRDNGVLERKFAASPVAVMEAEHETAGELLRQMREMSNDFTPPADACNTYRVTFAKLTDLEKDLHQHIHLENNILFPKAIALESDLLNRVSSPDHYVI